MRTQRSDPFWQDRRTVGLLGMGSALPGLGLSTGELLERIHVQLGVDVRRRGAALAQRLGIKTRHVCRDFRLRHEGARPGDSNADLAARALQAALEDAGVAVADLDYLIGHTTTPDTLLPPNVAQVAELIGYRGPFVEMRQACTGFANALIMALGLLNRAECGPVAIVGSETGSIYFDPQRAVAERGQLVNLMQMGDAAAACVLGPTASDGVGRISNVYFGRMDCARPPAFSLTIGAADPGSAPAGVEFAHDYRRVREQGPKLFAASMRAARSTGIDLRSVDCIIPHQVNGRIAAPLAAQLGVENERIFVNADRVGNTGSAAIWLALSESRSRLRSGASVCVLGAEATKYMYGGFLYVHG